MTERFTNNAQTTVTSGLNNITNPVTFLVASAAGFPTSGNFRILVDSEILLVTAVSGTSWTVSRGQESTTIASHANGATVTEVLTAASLSLAISESITTALAAYTPTASIVSPLLQDFRLTLESGVPISTTDQVAKNTIYCTPYMGNRISLYDGAATWTEYASAEFSLVLSGLVSGRPYDVFCFANAGVPTLEFLAWSSGTARATALIRQNGVLVKQGTTTRRYLGTFYTTGASTTAHSETARYLWNYYHRVLQSAHHSDSTSHSYDGSGGVRYFNNDSANKIEFVIGVVENVVPTYAFFSIIAGATAEAQIGPGLDSGTVFYQQGRVGDCTLRSAIMTELTTIDLGIGYHFVSVLEGGNGSVTATFDLGQITAWING